MKAVLERENLWEIVESKSLPSQFPATIGGILYTKVKLRDSKGAVWNNDVCRR